MGQAIMVGMAEIKVAQGVGDVLMALGLGSCVGICAYDARTKVAGMVHVVLPEQIRGDDSTPGKFANTAVPALLEQMQNLGASLERIVIAIVGGAQLFTFQGDGPRLDIGSRNTGAVTAVLKTHALRVVAQDIGGNAGRTVHLHTTDGRVCVKTIGQGERDLALLGEADFAQQQKAA